jgi:hypothetical protein
MEPTISLAPLPLISSFHASAPGPITPLPDIQRDR